ncbi:MAG TPA: hypothetical protein VGQ00_03220 [Candidatus Norongarragalinales archaeon]|jgi:small subunit ribosomal protein S3Ae|nr:hypothetical protein [Candidatus Norongarragalinales archaeon]
MAPPKKVVDTYKLKTWYKIVAPKFLNEAEVGEVPANEDIALVNRIIEVPLKDITRDLSHIHTTVKLRVSEIKGKTAFTKYIGHEIARTSIQPLVRKNRDMLDITISVVSKDGVEYVIKAFAITAVPGSGRQKASIRNMLNEELRAKAESTNFGDFVNQVLRGQFSGELREKLHKVLPIKIVDVRKTALKEEFDTPEKHANLEDEPVAATQEAA